jgi:hypothetical protein
MDIQRAAGGTGCTRRIARKPMSCTLELANARMKTCETDSIICSVHKSRSTTQRERISWSKLKKKKERKQKIKMEDQRSLLKPRRYWKTKREIIILEA